MTENEVGKIVLDCAFRVHSELGPGLFESVYETALEFELKRMGLDVKRQWPIRVYYEGIKMDDGFRLDLLVADKVVVEVKSIAAFGETHFKQLLTYLRFSQCKLGYLINFNEAHLKNGLKRIVYKLPE